MERRLLRTVCLTARSLITTTTSRAAAAAAAVKEMNSSDYGPRDLIGYGEETPDPCWPGNARIAINVVINYEEGSELTPVNGDDRTEVVGSELGIGLTPHFGQRDVNMESCYEYGSRAGIWRILRVLKDNGVKGTAYAVSDALRRHKDVAKAFERDGHEITSHGWRWIDRSGWTEEQEREYILKAINGALLSRFSRRSVS